MTLSESGFLELKAATKITLTWTSGKNLQYSSGSVVTSSSHSITPFIKLPGADGTNGNGYTLHISNTNSDAMYGVHYYDADQNHIGKNGGNITQDLQMESNVVYIRISIMTVGVSGFSLSYSYDEPEISDPFSDYVEIDLNWSDNQRILYDDSGFFTPYSVDSDYSNVSHIFAVDSDNQYAIRLNSGISSLNDHFDLFLYDSDMQFVEHLMFGANDTFPIDFTVSEGAAYAVLEFYTKTDDTYTSDGFDLLTTKTDTVIIGEVPKLYQVPFTWYEGYASADTYSIQLKLDDGHTSSNLIKNLDLPDHQYDYYLHTGAYGMDAPIALVAFDEDFNYITSIDTFYDSVGVYAFSVDEPCKYFRFDVSSPEEGYLINYKLYAVSSTNRVVSEIIAPESPPDEDESTETIPDEDVTTESTEGGSSGSGSGSSSGSTTTGGYLPNTSKNDITLGQVSDNNKTTVSGGKISNTGEIVYDDSDSKQYTTFNYSNIDSSNTYYLEYTGSVLDSATVNCIDSDGNSFGSFDVFFDENGFAEIVPNSGTAEMRIMVHCSSSYYPAEVSKFNFYMRDVESGIFNSVQNIGNKVNELLTDTKDFFGNFFENLKDAVVGLIVPSEEEMQSLIDELNTFFSEKFGFLYYPFDFLIRAFDVLMGEGAGTALTFPGFEIMGYEVWPDITYDITENEIADMLFTSVRIVTGALLSLAFINYLRAFFDKRFGGGGN